MTEMATVDHHKQGSAAACDAASKTAVVLAAHGERGGAFTNAALLKHADRLREQLTFACVSAGVLSGEPKIEDALAAARDSKAERIFIYPFFMANGYFVGKVLPQRIADASVTDITTVLPPLGVDPRLPALMQEEAVECARENGLKAHECRLLVAGHGSKGARASKIATEAIAKKLLGTGSFAEVGVGLLEEPPLLDDALAACDRPTIIAGFFSAPGLHAGEDVPQAMARAKTQTVFTGAIGASPGVSDLIVNGVLSSLRGQTK